MNKKLLLWITVTGILTILAIDDIVEDWSTIDGSFENIYIFFTQDLWDLFELIPHFQSCKLIYSLT